MKARPLLWILGAALAYLGLEVAKPFLEAAVFSAALSIGVWPLARALRPRLGRRFSCLALAAGLSMGVGAPALWAWEGSFIQIDELIQTMPSKIQAIAPGEAAWRFEIQQRAASQFASMRQEPAWEARVQASRKFAWAPLGLSSILLYFMLADGALAMAWARESAGSLGEVSIQAFESGAKAFEQSSKACIWFGGASAAILWFLFAWAGAPSPLALAVASACASMLPFIAPVMVAGIAVSLLAPGNLAGPIALLLIGAGGLGAANNIWRPKWVGDNSGLPMPIALLGMAGGAVAWGAAGLLAGPAIAAAVLAAVRGLPKAGT